ncbi:hypothetical protein [Helicobacter sp. MIT 14-3879]|uniref:hypothetical protein n=1 Tax=Helicobacter sp. MIT 14-3879 TaxID=2040649 RepID=UPI000E1F5A81|nr:hypothetical protein [Helicobacter sp. MIT 14-3879]RDU61713.1 hypothetical protein CQA44_08255 [Helicobacter sp. MIT 14-3879]
MESYLEVNISNRIKENSKEFLSLLNPNKRYNMQDVNINSLNTRGIKNEPIKLERNMKFKLHKFDILHFKQLEIVTTSGGAFNNGSIVQENTVSFGTHSYVNHCYNSFKKLQKRLFIPLNILELKETSKVILSLIFGKEQRMLKNNNPKVLYHSPNWDCFAHFSLEEFPRLLATLKELYKNGGGIHL